MSKDNYTRGLPYSGSTPGADANTYTLFDSTANEAAQMTSRRRAIVSLLNSHSGTLIAQVSSNEGTTWRALYSEAIGANTVTAYRAIRFDGFRDVRIQWTNGGTAQNPFVVTVSLDDGVGDIEVLSGGATVVSDGGGTLSVDDGGGSLTVDSGQLPATLGQKAATASLSVVEALSITNNTAYIASGDMSADVTGAAITVGPAGRVRFDIDWANTGTPIGTLMLQNLGADGATWRDIAESVAGFPSHPNNDTKSITAHFRELQIFASVRLKYVRTSGGTANTSLNVDTSVA